MDLSGKVAIVTGSARGIGRAIALKLAEVGADIVVNDIAAASESLEDTAAEIRALNRKALAVTADVSSKDDVNRMVEAAVTTFGHIDIMVNNAGVTRDQLIMRMTDEEWDTVLNIDLKSAFLCTRAVLRHMMRREDNQHSEYRRYYRQRRAGKLRRGKSRYHRSNAFVSQGSRFTRHHG
jgi:3-oxoacyl-[acyl-carrier protein] reductase